MAIVADHSAEAVNSLGLEGKLDGDDGSSECNDTVDGFCCSLSAPVELSEVLDNLVKTQSTGKWVD